MKQNKDEEIAEQNREKSIVILFKAGHNNWLHQGCLPPNYRIQHKQHPGAGL
jgi:hypothetical protein